MINQKAKLAVIWLDAYRSMPHNLVQLVLQQYRIPDMIRNCSREFNRQQFSFTNQNFTKLWQRLEVEIVISCIVLVMLFSSINELQDIMR